jgi:hypothetical protein
LSRLSFGKYAVSEYALYRNIYLVAALDVVTADKRQSRYARGREKKFFYKNLQIENAGTQAPMK